MIFQRNSNIDLFLYKLKKEKRNERSFRIDFSPCPVNGSHFRDELHLAPGISVRFNKVSALERLLYKSLTGETFCCFNYCPL